MSHHPVQLMFQAEWQPCHERILVHFSLDKLLLLPNDNDKKLPVFLCLLLIVTVLEQYSARSYLHLALSFIRFKVLGRNVIQEMRSNF